MFRTHAPDGDNEQRCMSAKESSFERKLSTFRCTPNPRAKMSTGSNPASRDMASLTVMRGGQGLELAPPRQCHTDVLCVPRPEAWL